MAWFSGWSSLTDQDERWLGGWWWDWRADRHVLWWSDGQGVVGGGADDDDDEVISWRRRGLVRVQPDIYSAPGNLLELTRAVSAMMPFIPTLPENTQRRAARFITNLCEAMLDLQQNRIDGWAAAGVKHYQRCADTGWDRERGNVKACLPSTSALSMMGNMKLGVARDDWPPILDAITQRQFQFVWTHFPCAKGPVYSSDKPRRLYEPREVTLERFQGDMEVQVGFTMDVMIAARDAAARLRSARGGYVAMVFNPVGAGAFVDRLSPEEQTLCMERIMRAILGGLRKRVSKACILFVSGGEMDCKGNWSWTNKMGNSVSVKVSAELRDVLFAGFFDCLSLSQELSRRKQFLHVAVTMAADKHRIGNAWLSHHWNRVTSRLEFSASNAADENNTRRSSLLPWVLKVNAPWLEWNNVDIRRVRCVRELAENFLSRPGRSDYNCMMSGFHTFYTDCYLPLLRANQSKSINVTELRQGIETVMVGDGIDER
jgi:hypothetical protein